MAEQRGEPIAADSPPDDRRARLAAFGVDSLEDDPELTGLSAFAAQLCGTPVASVTVLDDSCQVFLAREGLDLREIPIEMSFCAHALGGEDLFVIPDATKDPRFADNPVVTGDTHVRFYAGAPITTDDGTDIGALCVIDTQPHPDGLTDLQAEGLRVLATAARRRFINEREAIRMRNEARERTRLVNLVLDSVPGIAWSADAELNFDYFNARWAEVTGGQAPETVAEWADYIHPDDFAPSTARFEEAIGQRIAFSDEVRLRTADGTYRWVLSRAVPIELADGRWRWVGTLTDVDDAHRLSENRDLLARELSHRIKNIFAVISSLITLSARRDPKLRYFAQEMTDKVSALGRAHEFVAPAGTPRRTTLHGLLDQIFAPYNDGEQARVAVSGDDVDTQSRAATPLALVFHELATNSAKYGALSRDNGTVEVRIERIENETLRIIWQEPDVEAQEEAHEGFGSRLLRMSVEGQLQGRIDRAWIDGGLTVTLDLSLPIITG